MLTAKAFAPSASNERPVILGLSTGSVCLPPEWQPGSSAYATSKIAQIMLLDFIRAENPSMFVSTFHPGLIVTAMSHKAGNVDGPLPKDDSKSVTEDLVPMKMSLTARSKSSLTLCGLASKQRSGLPQWQICVG